jgi:hypothetical protein
LTAAVTGKVSHCGRVVDVHAADLDDDLPVRLSPDVHVRLAEDHEEVARAGLKLSMR